MQVTSLLSQNEHGHQHDHKHDDSCGCGHDHEHSSVHLWQAILGIGLVLNAFIVDWLFPEGTTVSSFSAFFGAIILIYPIVITAIKDLRAGRLSINELVAIAVLAAFASGAIGIVNGQYATANGQPGGLFSPDASVGYKTAGLIAFLMLMGELIETRTAEARGNPLNHSSNSRPPRPAAF